MQCVESYESQLVQAKDLLRSLKLDERIMRDLYGIESVNGKREIKRIKNIIKDYNKKLSSLRR